MTDKEVLVVANTKVVAQTDIESSVHTNSGSLEGPLKLPYSLNMSIMWYLEYRRERYKYFILSCFYSLLVN